MTYAIQASVREAEGTGASRRLRREGQIPCILYSEGQEPGPCCNRSETREPGIGMQNRSLRAVGRVVCESWIE